MICFRPVLLAERGTLERYMDASSKLAGVEADFANGKHRFAAIHADAVPIASDRVEGRDAAVSFDPMRLTVWYI